MVGLAWLSLTYPISSMISQLIEFSFFVTVLLLLWCCGGNCWGIYYCLYQSIIALFQVLKYGPHCHLSYFKCKRKCKPWPWWERAHKMRRRRSLAYHLVLKCCHHSGIRALDGTKILAPAYSKHKRWKERNVRSCSKYRHQDWHFFQPASTISTIVLHNWCYGDHDFTQLPHLLSSFGKHNNCMSGRINRQLR